jgi:PAS domain S-box-containing protein
MLLPDSLNSITGKIVTVMELKSAEICQDWFNALTQKWGEKAGQKAAYLKRERKAQTDLLSLLLRTLPDQREMDRQMMEPILEKVRRQEFSVLDFFQEITCLEESIEGILRRSGQIEEVEFFEGMGLIRKKLSGLLANILEDHSGVYEQVIKKGGRAFCQVDSEGKIIHANIQMRGFLGLKSATGKYLHEFFEGEEKDFVRAALTGKPGERPGIRRLQLITPNGKSIPVGVEIGPLIINGEKKGSYACIVNLSRGFRGEMEVFDESPVGIMKLTLNGEFTYVNRKALEIIGADAWQVRTIQDIFPDEENFQKVEKKLKRRKQGLSEEYEIEATRLDNGRRIPVMIAAAPEADLNGNIVGSMAIVRSVVIERAVEKIHKHIESIRDEQKMLFAVAEEIQTLVSFDLMAVAVYDADLRFVRGFFSYPARPDDQSPRKRWWKMSEAMGRWATQRSPFSSSFADLLAQEGFASLKNEPEIQGLLKGGFTFFLRYPVYHENTLVASLVFFKKGEKGFGAKDLEILKILPIDKAVLAALYSERTRDLEFRISLMQEIVAASNHVDDVTRIIVNRLRDQYHWQNVTLFRVDEKQKIFRLVSQKSTREACLRSGYEQSLAEGILGYVYQTQEDVNVGDVYGDPQFRSLFKPGAFLDSEKKASSELCLPIIFDGKVCWLLNIEDPQKNAFSDEEKRDLRMIVNEIGAFLQRAWLTHSLNAMLQSASDMVIFVGSDGRITRVNPATLKLLGYGEKNILGMAIGNLCTDADPDRVVSDRVTLRCADGSKISILLSGSAMPEQFGGKVYIGKDLTYELRARELEDRAKMFQEIAIQTKTPLSLAYHWLDGLKKEAGASPAHEVQDVLDKTLQQLRKADLTYDRLAFYDAKAGVMPYHEVLFDYSELLSIVREDFPSPEAGKIQIEKDKNLPYLRGDLSQLSFCLESILSYLLRFSPDKGVVQVRVFADPKREGIVATEISGLCPVAHQEGAGQARQQLPLSRSLAEMALGESIMKSFINQHGGQLHEPRREGEKIAFQIDLPAARG